MKSLLHNYVNIESILSMLLHQNDVAGGIVSMYGEYVNSKKTAYHNAERTYERTLNALDILKKESKNLQASIKSHEEFRVSCAEKLEAIDKLPQLTQDQAIIEQKEHKLQEMVMYKEE